MDLLGSRASGQHGLVSWRQLLDAGVPRSTAACWARTHRLQRLHPGVYRMRGAPSTWEQSLLAAVLAAGEGAVASHRSAARLWGLGDHDAVEITVPQPRSPRLRGVTVHRSGDLQPRWMSQRHSVPVTGSARTLVDLGAVLPAPMVEDALDRALSARLLSVATVEAAVDALAAPGRNGIGAMRSVLDERALGAARPDGLLEPRMARVLATAELPPPEFQHQIGRYRADFAYPDRRIAIEVDGFACHGSPRALQADLERQNDLVNEGWTVLRFTWVDVVRRPAKVASVVRDALTNRRP